MTFEEVKKTNKFTWGEPVAYHEIGPYQIVEYYEWKSVDGIIYNNTVDNTHTQFHGWFSGQDSNESWPTLETAIAGLIGLKYAGWNNGGIGYYFCKMADAPPYDKTTRRECV